MLHYIEYNVVYAELHRDNVAANATFYISTIDPEEHLSPCQSRQVKSQSPEVLKTQTSKRTEEDRKTDSFAHHTPRIRVSKRTSEIRSKPPVCGDRDDYKTIPLQMFPSSSGEGD
uniref:Uncharacterized protein n=1 Tax=Parascaris univalens TaxID=6257 RepID=A0A915A0L9_PARUN